MVLISADEKKILKYIPDMVIMHVIFSKWAEKDAYKLGVKAFNQSIDFKYDFDHIFIFSDIMNIEIGL